MGVNKMKMNGLVKTGLLLLSILLVAIASYGLAGCQLVTRVEEPMDKVTLGLSWIHQAQFSGEYYADQKGIYEKEGIDITLVPAQIDRDPMQDLIDGKLDFVIAQPDTLAKARVAGAKVKAIAATYRIHPLVFCSLPESQIKRPQDFVGKTVGVAYSEEIILRAMLKKMGIDANQVNIVGREYNFKGLTSGRLDVQGAWITDEVQTAKRKGIAFTAISPVDYRVVFYADVIGTTENMIQKNPGLVERFLRATLEGWQKAIEDPEKNSQLTLLYDQSLSAVHEQDVLEASLPLIHTGEDHIGWMKKAAWDDMYATLVQVGVVEDALSPEDLYTMEFLQRVYGEQ